MSDRPLFQDADEQEATYAPQQVPAGDAGDGTIDTGVPLVALPIAATGAAASTAGPGYAGGSAGTVSGVIPALGAAALANETERDEEDEARRRD
jgi:hypothetical protein